MSKKNKKKIAVVNNKLTGLSVKNIDTTKSSGDLYIYGEITEDKWWETDVTPQDITEALAELEGVENINLFVNSPGGGVYAGMAIYNILNRFSENCTITAHIDGIAASIAGVIIMVADKIVMPANTLIMIHDPLLGICGYYNAKELQDIIDVLGPVKDTILNVFEARLSISREEIEVLMNAETYITAEKALEYGIIDEVGELKELKSETNPEDKNIKVVNGVNFDTKNFKNFPKNFLDLDVVEEDPEDGEGTQEIPEEVEKTEEDNQPQPIDYTELENSLKLTEDFISLY
jgi:ATP-dependent Clp endopeptidase proteolytic subunit ClpP